MDRVDVGAPFAAGRSADVFDIGGGRVLRRYRDGGDVAAEAAVMAYVGGLGFPVPAVHSARGADLVMERLDGPTMVAAFGTGGLDLAAGAEILADLHARLHALPARLATDAGSRILHLDLHPDNVMLTSRGPVVIDWRNSAEGPADLDVALSALILAQVAVGPEPLAAAAGTLLSDFLTRVGGDPVRMLDRAAARRRTDRSTTVEESANLDRAVDLVRSTAASVRGA